MTLKRSACPGGGRPSAMWLWSGQSARAAVATGNLAVIVRTYRAVAGVSQRELADRLGYDPTYISMIETGRREINDVMTRRRLARYMGLPPRALGVADPDDADAASMIQFGESTVRLAAHARVCGHATVAVDELWPLVVRLEARATDGLADYEMVVLLARARAELGVCLGYVLPEERLANAARWTGRALRLAERLDDPQLLAFTLRVHGNELRKTGHCGAAVARFRRAAAMASGAERATTLMQFARAAGEHGDAALFDRVMTRAWNPSPPKSSPASASISRTA